jgi:hypothetical protein
MRRRERDDVTLICAWRTPEAIVVHADSQETIGYHRATVKKIVPETMGQFSVIAVGAGQPGELLDSFSTRLTRAITASISSVDEFASRVEATLQEFYAVDVDLCPDIEKSVKFLIGVCHIPSKQYQAWVTEHITLRPLRDDEPELLGWDEPLYRNVAKQLFASGISTAQAVLAGVNTMGIAEATSNYVHRPFKVAIIRDNGIWMEPDDYVSEMSERLQEYEQRLTGIFLACADISISIDDLQNKLQKFLEAAVYLHRFHIDSYVKKFNFQTMLQTNDPYPRLPHPNLISYGPAKGFSFEHDPEKLKAHGEHVGELMKLAQTNDWDLCCAECETEYQYRISKLGASDWACPTCRNPIKTVGKVASYKKMGEAMWIDAAS